MEQQIINYLIKKYNPIGIILHGSRGAKDARIHSDWDLFVFTETPISNRHESNLDTYNYQSLDIMILEFPLSDEELKRYIVKYISSSRLVFQHDKRIIEMFDTAKRIYDLGISLTVEEINYQHNILSKDINRLSDWIDDDSGTFYLRCSDIYRLIYNLWWKIKKSHYSISPRRGLEIIKLNDSEFYNTLIILAKNNSNIEKYKAIRKLETLLFS